MKEQFKNEPFAKRPEKESLPENVVIVERPEARYRLIYEFHDLPHTPEEIGKPDALVSEGIVIKGYSDRQSAQRAWAELLAKTEFEIIWSQNPKRIKRLIRQMEHLERIKTPLYLIDIVDPKRELIDRKHFTYTLKEIEKYAGTAGLAASTIFYALKRLGSQKGLTRRDFLKTAAMAIPGIYFGTQLLDDIVDWFNRRSETRGEHSSQISVAGKFKRGVRAVQETLHPQTEAILFILRNALWSIKLETIAKRIKQETVQKPEVAMILGANHVGLESMFKESPEKRLKTIKSFLRVFGPKESRPYLADIAKLEYTGKKWKTAEIFEDPGLKKIEEEIWEK